MVIGRESGKHSRTAVSAGSGTSAAPTIDSGGAPAIDSGGAPAIDSGAATQPSSSPSSHRKTVFMRLGMVGLLALLCGLAFWLFLQGKEESDDAYLDGHISNVSSRISGTVAHVFVDDNELVKPGQPLVELDPTDMQVRVEQAEAALEQARYQAQAAKQKVEMASANSLGKTTQADADVSSMQAQIEAAQWAVHRARADIRQWEMKVKEQEAQVKYAQADFERYQNVYKDHVVTKQQYDKAKTAFDIAQAQLQEAENSLQSARDREVEAKAQLNDSIGRLQKSKGEVTAAGATIHEREVNQEEYRGTQAAVKQAEANLKKAELDLSYCHISAPVEGRVGRKSVEVGQRVEAGQMLMAVVQEKPWISANFKETQVGHVRRGERAEIKIDTFPGMTFSGHVDSISPASGATFSMLPPDNATGNFTKVVQRIEVKIVFDDDSIKPIARRLAPGMSCEVTVFTTH